MRPVARGAIAERFLHNTFSFFFLVVVVEGLMGWVVKQKTADIDAKVEQKNKSKRKMKSFRYH